MKKTLTLFLATATALVSSVATSSCSGGGDKSATSDYVVTLNDFQKGKKQFNIYGLVRTIIRPEIGGQGEHGATGNVVRANGYVDFAGAEYYCYFTYETDEADHKDGMPRMGYLTITFEDMTACTSPSVMQSLGLDPGGDGLVGAALKMQFNFATFEVQVMSSTQGTVTINYPDPMGEYMTFDGWVRSVFNADFTISKKD